MHNGLQRDQACPDDGTLRLLVTAAEGDGDVEDARVHAQDCLSCAARMEQLGADAQACGQALHSLGGTAEEVVDARRAYLEVRRRIVREQLAEERFATGGNWMNGFLHRRGGRAAVALLVVLALSSTVAFTPVRTLADNVLSQFRVEKFAAVTIPMDLVSQGQALSNSVPAGDRQALQDQLSGLGSFQTNLSKDSARQVGSIDEAAAHYGSILKVPTHLADGFGPNPNVYVSDDGTASVTVNVAAVQQAINQYHIPIYSLPDASQYPTLTFTAHMPKAVVFDYTNAAGDKHIVVGQAVSPTLDIPAGVDMNALRNDVLAFPGLPADLVGQLRSVDDWQHTLIIPIPQGATSSDVTVNGHPGLLIEMANNGGSAVIWQQNGTLYAVAGQVDKDTILSIAASM
jgi:hypothetical protein